MRRENLKKFLQIAQSEHIDISTVAKFAKFVNRYKNIYSSI